MFHNFDLNHMVTMIIPLALAVTVHEVAHGYTAFKMGDNTALLAGRLTFNPVKHLDFIGSFLLPIILKLFGSPIIFGYAKPVPVNFANLKNYRRGTIYVASAGVVANICLAVISSALFQTLLYLEPIWHGSAFRLIITDLVLMLGYSVMINAILAVFNLIPIPPLDGSRIFAMFLPPHFRIQFARIERFGMIIIFFLLMTNLLSKFMSFFLNPLLDFLL